jgi:hypothetical protein
MKQLLIVVLALVFSFTALATGPAIGFVQASGDFRLNQAATRGNGTLFDGSVLETGMVRSDVSLTSGGHIALAPNSKTQIFKDRAVLQTGTAEMSASGYTLIAAKLNISGSSAQVAVDSPTKVRVGALSAPVEVRNSGNILIARVNPGTTLEFDNQGGASGAVTVAGTVTKEGDNYFITDKTTNVKYQLQGTGLDKWINKTATISGSLVPNATPLGGATGVIAVSSSKKGLAAAAAGGAAAGAAVGLSSAAIAGIAVAVAAGGIVGGLAAAGSFSSASNP